MVPNYNSGSKRGMTFSIFSYCHIAKMSEPMPTLTAMEKKAKHKGRAYSCVRCSRTGKSYTDVKSRVENHIYKYHPALDQFCTLCLFRSSEKTPLQHHVHTYNRHRQEARKMGITDSTPYLQESPYSDYVQHSQQESLKLFLQKIKYFQSEPNLLASAINQTFGRELINEGPAPTCTDQIRTINSLC